MSIQLAAGGYASAVLAARGRISHGHPYRVGLLIWGVKHHSYGLDQALLFQAFIRLIFIPVFRSRPFDDLDFIFAESVSARRISSPGYIIPHYRINLKHLVRFCLSSVVKHRPRPHGHGIFIFASSHTRTRKLFFSFFEAYKKELALMIKSEKSCVVQRKCREYLHKDEYIHYALRGVETKQQQEYATTFVISGMVAMLEQWLREDSLAPIDAYQLALLVCRFTDTHQ